jgi:hypothetical protein
VTPTETVKVELPTARLPFNFQNSVQLRHEAEEVRRCILAGKLLFIYKKKKKKKKCP